MLGSTWASVTGWHSHTSENPSDSAHRSRDSILSRLARLAPRNRQDASPATASTLHDAMDLDEDTRKNILIHRLRNATTQAEWHYTAVELDDLEGNNDWKYEIESTEYNYALIQARLEQLEDARISCDVERMLFLIRTSLSRHLGGMGNIRLYKHSHVGTKVLIERYINSALDTIRTFLDTTKLQKDGQDPRHLLEQVLAARQSFGRSALLLSGGGTFGMNHIGVVKCLWENNLLPRIITGASAGSIVSAVLCTRKDSEMDGCLDDFCYGDLEVFTKTGVDDSLLQQATRFLKTGAMFDVSNLTRVMRNLMGDMTFQEAYNRTRRILNICVSSASVFELPRLLNYVTAPNVVIWSAVAASCSVPGIFTAASLLAKDSKTNELKPWNPSPQRWVDGSIEGDIPTTRIAEMFNVNHFIVSQVNPHVVPFLTDEKGPQFSQTSDSGSVLEAGPSWLNSVSNLARTEALHRMHVLSELGVFPNFLTKVSNVLSQRYSGDITILPQIPLSQFPNILRNPNTEYMLNALLLGERATWPQLDRIKVSSSIELALDNAVHELRARIAFPNEVQGSARQRARRTMSGSIAHLKLNGNPVTRLSSTSLRNRYPPQGALAQIPQAKVATSSSPNTHRRRESPFSLSLDTRLEAHGDKDDAGRESAHSATSAQSQDESDDGINDSSTSDEVTSPSDVQSPTRPLFPHASQPSTPAHRMPRLGYFTVTSPLAHRVSPVTSRLAMSPSQSRTIVDDAATQTADYGFPSGLVGASESYASRPLNRREGSWAGSAPSQVWEGSTRTRRSMSTGIKTIVPPNAR